MIILERAPNYVRSKQAYLKTCLPEFFAHLREELEDDLTKKADNFYGNSFIRNPEAVISAQDCYAFLLKTVEELPFPADVSNDRSIYANAERRAATKLQLEGDINGRHLSAENVRGYQKIHDQIKAEDPEWPY